MSDEPPSTPTASQTPNERHRDIAPTYRIGAVSRLTGVPPDTLRVWERRYRVVQPYRSDCGTRLYCPLDLSRLALIKRLVDQGDAIGSVAGLSIEQLRERLAESERGAELGAGLTSDRSDSHKTTERPLRVAVLGLALGARLAQEPDEPDGLELLGPFDSPEAFLAGVCGQRADLALLDFPTLQPDQVPEIARLASESGIARTLVLYRFATRATIGRLAARQIASRRSPVDRSELCRWSRAPRPGSLPADARGVEVDLGLPPPPRRFDAATLVRIAAASDAIRCECPKQLTELIAALGAFEDYSAGCELRQPDDAALHAYLHAAAAQARSLMETALARVAEAEGIPMATPAGSKGA